MTIFTLMNSTSGNKQKGMTLIELVTVIVLMGIISLVVYPLIYSGADSTKMVYESTQAMRQSTSFFLFLRPQFSDGAVITSANSQSVIYNYDGSQFQIAVTDFPGTAPYTGGLSVNGGPYQTLVSGLAELNAPARPGLEFFYYDQSSTETGLTENIKLMEVRLNFKTPAGTVPYSSSIAVDTEEVSL